MRSGRRSPGRRRRVLHFIDGRGRHGVLRSGIRRNGVTDLVSGVGDTGTRVGLTPFSLIRAVRDGTFTRLVRLARLARLIHGPGRTDRLTGRRRRIVVAGVTEGETGSRQKRRLRLIIEPNTIRTRRVQVRGLRGLGGLRGTGRGNLFGIVPRSLRGGPLLDLPLQGSGGEPHGGAALKVAAVVCDRLGHRLSNGLLDNRSRGSGRHLGVRLGLGLSQRLRRNLRLGNDPGHMDRGGDTGNGTTPVSGTPRRRLTLRSISPHSRGRGRGRGRNRSRNRRTHRRGPISPRLEPTPHRQLGHNRGRPDRRRLRSRGLRSNGRSGRLDGRRRDGLGGSGGSRCRCGRHGRRRCRGRRRRSLPRTAGRVLRVPGRRGVVDGELARRLGGGLRVGLIIDG